MKLSKTQTSRGNSRNPTIKKGTTKMTKEELNNIKINHALSFFNTTQINKYGPNTKEIFLESSKYCKGQDFNGTKQLEFQFDKYSTNSLYQMYFAVTSIISSFLWYELSLITKSDPILYLILTIIFLNSIFLWITIFFDAYISAQILYEFKQIKPKFWYFQSDLIQSVIIKLVAFFFHPNPLFHYLKTKVLLNSTKFPSANAQVELNAIFAFLCCTRLFYILKYILLISKYHSARTQRICEINDFDTNLFFCLKCLMTERPYEVYITSFSILLFITGFALKVTESGLTNVSGNNFGYLNAIWYTFVTMVTVGYGDLSPSSDIGRVIGIFSCFIGIYLISMVLVSFSNILQLNNDEYNIYQMINKIETNTDKEKMAKELTQQYFYLSLKLKSKKSKIDNEEVQKQRDNLLLTLQEYKEKTTIKLMEKPLVTEEDIVLKKCSNLESSIEYINHQAEVLVNSTLLLSKRLLTKKTQGSVIVES